MGSPVNTLKNNKMKGTGTPAKAKKEKNKLGLAVPSSGLDLA